MASRIALRTATQALIKLPTTIKPPSLTRPFSSTPKLFKTAIVTGAGRGIGKSIATRLARDGYDVTVNDIQANQSLVEEVVDSIRQTGRKATVALGDVSRREEVKRVIQTSVKELGPLDTMVANAGIAQVKPLLNLTDDDFRRMFEVNVFGVYYSYIEAARQMIEQGDGGKLIGCASIVAFKPFPLLSHYSASKWAVRGLTQAMAMEMAEHRITVNAYAPGVVGTAMWDLIDEELGKARGVKKGDTFKEFTEKLTALGRPSVPKDVSKVVSFLAGPDSEFVTGQTLVVDGGIIYT